jgi:hypothetical protein
MTAPAQLNPSLAMQQAAQLEASGQVAAAENIYRQILAAAPRYHTAYHALATLAQVTIPFDAVITGAWGIGHHIERHE